MVIIVTFSKTVDLLLKIGSKTVILTQKLNLIRDSTYKKEIFFPFERVYLGK